MTNTLPALLRLPLELRQHVHTHLIPAHPLSHPLPKVGITSVSHRPPPLSLLLTCRQLCHEALNTFYALAMWKIIISHAFNFFRLDPRLEGLAASPQLGWIRRVEVVFFWDEVLLKEYPSFRIEKVAGEMGRRAESMVDVLVGGARELRVCRTGWIDTTERGRWEEKRGVLEPLRRLGNRGVRFECGEVVAVGMGVEEGFREEVERLGTIESLLMSSNGALI